MEIEDVKKEIVKIIKKELMKESQSVANLSVLSGFSAFFFGSRVTGTNSPTSDLDVGIEGQTAVPENILRSIKSQCESIPTLYKIDIVDFAFISEDFKKVAKLKIEKIV